MRGGYSDYKSDIYSLGITIYEMVTGRVPFDGDTTVAIAIKHLQEEIEAPSKYTPSLPFSLEQIILKCTQKSPDRRYKSMGELIDDLKHSLVDPNGNFVTLMPLSSHAQTVMVSEDELDKIRSGSAAMAAKKRRMNRPLLQDTANWRTMTTRMITFPTTMRMSMTTIMTMMIMMTTRTMMTTTPEAGWRK